MCSKQKLIVPRKNVRSGIWRPLNLAALCGRIGRILAKAGSAGWHDIVTCQRLVTLHYAFMDFF